MSTEALDPELFDYIERKTAQKGFFPTFEMWLWNCEAHFHRCLSSGDDHSRKMWEYWRKAFYDNLEDDGEALDRIEVECLLSACERAFDAYALEQPDEDLLLEWITARRDLFEKVNHPRDAAIWPKEVDSQRREAESSAT
jgi:hypothetical protein